MANLQFAEDELGNRILPSPKGKGFCPVCEGAMIAKCGDIYRWHWQHVRDRNCDSWKEHETRWHREWKEKFPPECREVIIENNGEKHIADILTKSGTVIEFQNSSISAGTILTRETFYDDMIWVINARSFRDNFTIKSTVIQKLWKLDRSYDLDKKLNYDPECDLADFNRKIENLEYERDLFKDRAENERLKLMALEKALEGLNKFVTQVLASWESYRVVAFYIPGIAAIADNLKLAYSERTRKISAVKAELDEAQRRLAVIHKMEPYFYKGVNYVFTAFEALRPDLIDRCIVIRKADKDTMFPTILKFRSEYDFQSYQHKSSTYLFAINPALTLDKLNSDVTRLQNEHQVLIAELPDYRILLTQRFTKFLQDELKLNEQRYYEAEEKQMEVQSKIYSLEIQRTEYKDELQEQFAQSLKEDKTKHEAEKSRIMKTYRGQYSFVWKRERRSWTDTLCPVYFDIGEDYLFERTGADSLVKMPIAEFLTKHL